MTITDLELRNLIEAGDIGVYRHPVIGLRVYAITNVPTGRSSTYVGSELLVDNPIRSWVIEMIESNELVINYLDGAKIYNGIHIEVWFLNYAE